MICLKELGAPVNMLYSFLGSLTKKQWIDLVVHS